ncbi:MAG: hypothetical protein RKP20_01795 [Candidatus Competibacter sp.]|nr:hypothetical protein [Candidatus Competibacter sp.]
MRSWSNDAPAPRRAQDPDRAVREQDAVSVEPFNAIALELGALWGETGEAGGG